MLKNRIERIFKKVREYFFSKVNFWPWSFLISRSDLGIRYVFGNTTETKHRYFDCKLNAV